MKFNSPFYIKNRHIFPIYNIYIDIQKLIISFIFFIDAIFVNTLFIDVDGSQKISLNFEYQTLGKALTSDLWNENLPHIRNVQKKIQKQRFIKNSKIWDLWKFFKQNLDASKVNQFFFYFEYYKYSR